MQTTEAWKHGLRAQPVLPADQAPWQQWGSNREEWLFPGSRVSTAEKQTQSGGGVDCIMCFRMQASELVMSRLES